jgi:hypothetical protein
VQKNEINISLSAVSAQLNEVVVTALGIKREKKALGYAVSTVEKKGFGASAGRRPGQSAQW